MATEYGSDFFDLIRDGCVRSAQVVVPLVLDELGKAPETVIDVGCGEGWWGRQFNLETGCQVLGLDSGDVEPVIPFMLADLNERLPGLPLVSADLVVCLEVAEHLPPERADTFIEDLCGLAPRILFSAAIPGQGGHGHLNEQWQTWWARKFERYGYLVRDVCRESIWDDSRVEPWYRQNLMLATRASGVDVRGLSRVTDVVHPIYWRDRGHGEWV